LVELREQVWQRRTNNALHRWTQQKQQLASAGSIGR
jgi:hypothetical protein